MTAPVPHDDAQSAQQPLMPSATYALDSTWRPLLKDLGVSSAHVLRRAGLPQDLLSKPAVRLEARDFHRFWEAIGVELNDPLFPLTLCQAIKTESFSPPLFAALCSPNFLVATQRIARYKRLIAPMRLVIREDKDSVTLELAWLDANNPPPHSLVMLELLFFVALIRLGTREHIRPLQLLTPLQPRPDAAYEDFFGVHCARGKAHRIVFKRTDALRPFLTSNPGLWAAFEPELRTRLAELDACVSTGARVRAALLEALPGGPVAMAGVASGLAMSQRTLQRQLEAEGTSYARLLKQTREALARHYLNNTRLPSAEISFLLGFEEPNSFYRAFRDWTGLSPEQARLRAQPGPSHGHSTRSPTPSITRSQHESP